MVKCDANPVILDKCSGRPSESQPDSINYLSSNKLKLKQSREVLKCRRCNKDFRNAELLRSHIYRQHRLSPRLVAKSRINFLVKKKTGANEVRERNNALVASAPTKNGPTLLPPVLTKKVSVKVERLPDSLLKEYANKTGVNTTEIKLVSEQTETVRRPRSFDLNVAVCLKRLPESIVKKYVGKFNNQTAGSKFTKRAKKANRKQIANKYHRRKAIDTKRPNCLKQTSRKNQEKSDAGTRGFTCSLAKVASLNWEYPNSNGCTCLYNLGTPVVLLEKLPASHGSSITKDALCNGEENNITDIQDMVEKLPPACAGSETEVSQSGQVNSIANNQDILKLDQQAMVGSRSERLPDFDPVDAMGSSVEIGEILVGAQNCPAQPPKLPHWKVGKPRSRATTATAANKVSVEVIVNGSVRICPYDLEKLIL